MTKHREIYARYGFPNLVIFIIELLLTNADLELFEGLNIQESVLWVYDASQVLRDLRIKIMLQIVSMCLHFKNVVFFRGSELLRRILIRVKMIRQIV